MKSAFLTAVLAIAGCLTAGVSLSRADLLPSEVIILANGNVPASMMLARQYANARAIPRENILAVPCPFRDQISRDQYDRLIAKPLRLFIKHRDLAGKARVIVTIYGIPLKVGPAQPSPAQRVLAGELENKYREQFISLERILNGLQRLAGVTTTAPVTLPARDASREFSGQITTIGREFNQAMQLIRTRLQQETSESVGQKLAQDAFTLRLELGGLEGITNSTTTADQTATNPSAADFRERIGDLEQEFQSLLSEEPEDRDVDRSYQLAKQLGGQMRLVRTIRDDIVRLEQQNSHAAVDSELTLVMHERYMLAGRIPNVLNVHEHENPFAAKWQPVLMTARLDGPDPAVVGRMIDDAVKTEKSGLIGKVYIDARGLKGQDGLGFYDRDLVKLADTLKRQTTLPVVLNNQESLFAPDNCPQTALYCGWYSLKKYIPAFRFVPGAVAYHIASFEAASLHDPKLNLWCPRLLEAGACATLGPVDEPFVDAFPLPSEFFSLLLSGKYCLVEAFFATQRYNSWQMILLGDPLYRPFARNPQSGDVTLTDQKIPLQLLP